MQLSQRQSELLKTAWRVHNGVNEDSRLRMTALEILMEQSSASNCVCVHHYRQVPAEMSDNNSTDKFQLKDAVAKAFSEGREKGNNIMLIGPKKCGKTFILSQLTEIFKCFVYPAPGVFVWVGAEKAEIIFLKK